MVSAAVGMPRDVVFVDGVRTPFGKAGGRYAHTRADDLATHAVGELLRAEPEPVAPVIRRWAAADDLWLRRAALVCQVGAKGRTDGDLLADIIVTVAAPPEALSRDFFVRKGIGWALRDYARTDPDWVRSFVDAHADRLSPLSIREATKHLPEARPTGE